MINMLSEADQTDLVLLQRKPLVWQELKSSVPDWDD